MVIDVQMCGAEAVDQLVECLSSMQKALGSISSLATTGCDGICL